MIRDKTVIKAAPLLKGNDQAAATPAAGAGPGGAATNTPDGPGVGGPGGDQPPPRLRRSILRDLRNFCAGLARPTTRT